MMPRLTWTASVHLLARASSIASSTYCALGLMRSANSAIACPPECVAYLTRARKPLSSPRTTCPASQRGMRSMLVQKPARLLSGIRRVALFVAGAGARLYKELRVRAARVQHQFTIWKEDVYEIAEVARRACGCERGAGGLRHDDHRGPEDQRNHQGRHRSAGQGCRSLGCPPAPERRQARRQAGGEGLRGLEPHRCMFHAGVVPAG